MKVSTSCLSTLAGVAVLLTALPSQAALPDEETYTFVTNRYNLLLQNTRSGCGYYTNPNTLSIKQDERSLIVLLTRGETGGTMCNGVFEFKALRVRCKTGEIAYIDLIGSPADWKEDWDKNPEVAKQVCSLRNAPPKK